MIQYLPGTYPLGRREAGGICGHLQSEEGQDVLKRFAEAESSGQLMTCWRDAEDVKKISKDNPSNHQDDYIFTRGIPIKLQFKPLIPGFFGQKQSYGELDLMICSRLRGDKAVLHMQLPNLRMQLAAAGQRHSMKAKTKWTKMSHSIRWHIEKTCRNTWTKLLGPRCNLIKTILLDFLFERWFFSDDFVTFSRGGKNTLQKVAEQLLRNGVAKVIHILPGGQEKEHVLCTHQAPDPVRSEAWGGVSHRKIPRWFFG